MSKPARSGSIGTSSAAAAMPWVRKADEMIKHESESASGVNPSMNLPGMQYPSASGKEVTCDNSGSMSRAERQAEAIIAKLDERKKKQRASSSRPQTTAVETPAVQNMAIVERAGALAPNLSACTPQTSVNICGMPIMVQGGNPQKPRKYQPEAREEAITVQAVHDLMEGIDDPEQADVERHAPRARSAALQSSHSAGVVVSFEPNSTYSKWLQDKDNAADELIAGNPSEIALAKRKLELERKEHRQRERHDRKQKLLKEAMDARMLFGASSFEKQTQRKRREMTRRTTFEQERARRLTALTRSIPRRSFVAVVAAIAESYLVVSLFISKDGSPTEQPRTSAPQSVSLFGLAAALGCVVYLLCLMGLFLSLQVLGAKSLILLNLAKTVTSSLYLARSAWVYSIVSFVLYLSDFFKRVDADVVENDGSTYVVAVFQVLCGIVLVPALLFLCMASHNLLEDIHKFVFTTSLAKHFSYNIEIQLTLSSVILIMVSVGFQRRIHSIDDQSLFVVMTYLAVGAGGILILFAFTHLHVTKKLVEFEKKELTMEDEKEAIEFGLRLQIVDKNPCVVSYSPDKPSLVGKHGVVVGNGVDKSGLVKVLINGQEYKMQEYQLLPDIPPEKQNACEQAEMSELAGLKYAELEYNFERQHKAVLRRMSVYIVASQIFSAMMITAFLALLRWSDAMSMRLYDSISTLGTAEITSNPSTVPGIEGIDCSATGLTSYQRSRCTNVQSFICGFWEQCTRNESNLVGVNATGTPNPVLCGDPTFGKCRVAPNLTDTGPGLSYGGCLVIGAVVGAVAGLCLTAWAFHWKVTRHGGRRVIALNTICAALTMATILSGGVGTMAAHIIYTGVDASPRCDRIDLDSSHPGVQRLPVECVVVTGAYFIHQDIALEFKGFLLGPAVTCLICLLESTLRVGNKVGELNRNAFAAFEAAIGFIYTSLAIGFWMSLRSGRLEAWFNSFDFWTLTTSEMGLRTASRFGLSFPLTFNQTFELARQEELADTILTDWTVVYVLGGIVLSLQMLGLYFATIGQWTNPYWWTVGVKVVLYLNSFVHAYFVFIIFICLYAVNVKYNVLAFVLVPACCLYCFAVKFALLSDIWPIQRDQGFLRYLLSLLWRIGPLSLATMFMVGLAFERTRAKTTGVIIMVVSGGVGMAILALLLLFLFNEVIGWSLDVLQLASDKLFGPPRRQEDVEEKSEADTDDVAMQIVENA